ncbi:MAG TPA: TlpA family protein disulfide reductase [Nitrococcus sp.]|nr:TlpA family protein disulfide reductase [Nitrococcus sp.]
MAARRLACCLIGLVLMLPALAAPQPVQPFRAESLAQIQAAQGRAPFVLVLWSLDCPPCFHELELLGRLHRADPALQLVLVATDSYAEPGVRSAIRGALERFGLDGVEAWAFAGDSQRLRYAIDPHWYGELPRSYFYGPGQPRDAVSGLLDEARVRAFMARFQPRVGSD